MRPIVFEQTLGWFHHAPGHCGVLIAGADGFEDLCSRQFLTVLARRLAANGFPVLQFDYPGRGNAVGDPLEPGRVKAWLASISKAIDVLKSESSVTQVLVVGFRLGALLAPHAIKARTDVVGLALLAPPASGRTYVRELTGLSRIVDAALPRGPLQSNFDGVEAAGFRTSADTIEELRAVAFDDTTMSLSALDVLLMTNQTVREHETFAQRVLQAGGSTEIEPFEGYGRMMSRPLPDAPLSPITIVVNWAGKRKRSLAECMPPRSPAPQVLAGSEYVELPQLIGPFPRICGVLCLPKLVTSETKVVLLLNSGAIPHLGTAGSGVEMARFLAKAGIASMRIDLPGLGQSESYTDKRTPLYDVRTREDVSRVVKWLDHYGFKRICVAGLCAGAFQAFHAARRDPLITELIMVNPVCFSWDSSYALDMELSNIRDNASVGNSVDNTLPNHSNVARRGTGPYVRFAKRSLRFGMELLKTGFLTWKRLTKGSVDSWIRELAARGTRILIVSSVGDLSVQEIARHFGPGGERLQHINGVTNKIIPEANHTLTPLHARNTLNALIRDFLSVQT